MAAYYNEIDPFAAAWLRELIKVGLIADGDVDERSIEFVRPDDLRGYAQCHFFAGIGGWSAALRLAGWPDDRPVWTGSCPCQPFSAAGKGRGKDDARHLWPQFRRLIRQCRPAVVFGEQVASKAGRVWLSAVFADLEALAYRAAGADLCGPSVGAYDIRQRLFFVGDTHRPRRKTRHAVTVGDEARSCQSSDAGLRRLADSDGTRRASRRAGEASDGRDAARVEPSGLRAAGELADTDGGHAEHGGVQRGREHGLRAEDRRADGRQGDAERAEVGVVADVHIIGRGQGPAHDARRGEGTRAEGAGLGSADDHGSGSGRLGDTSRAGLSDGERAELSGAQRHGEGRAVAESGRAFWADVEWLPCRDGKYRPTQPGVFPLAHGVSGRMVVRRTSLEGGTEVQAEHWYSRVGALRGFGNAIKPQVAAAFIEAYCEARG